VSPSTETVAGTPEPLTLSGAEIILAVPRAAKHIHPACAYRIGARYIEYENHGRWIDSTVNGTLYARYIRAVFAQREGRREPR
jgi:hypothetical protein